MLFWISIPYSVSGHLIPNICLLQGSSHSSQETPKGTRSCGIAPYRLNLPLRLSWFYFILCIGFHISFPLKRDFLGLKYFMKTSAVSTFHNPLFYTMIFSLICPLSLSGCLFDFHLAEECISVSLWVPNHLLTQTLILGRWPHLLLSFLEKQYFPRQSYPQLFLGRSSWLSSQDSQGHSLLDSITVSGMISNSWPKLFNSGKRHIISLFTTPMLGPKSMPKKCFWDSSLTGIHHPFISSYLVTL